MLLPTQAPTTRSLRLTRCTSASHPSRSPSTCRAHPKLLSKGHPRAHLPWPNPAPSRPRASAPCRLHTSVGSTLCPGEHLVQGVAISCSLCYSQPGFRFCATTPPPLDSPASERHSRCLFAYPSPILREVPEGRAEPLLVTQPQTLSKDQGKEGYVYAEDQSSVLLPKQGVRESWLPRVLGLNGPSTPLGPIRSGPRTQNPGPRTQDSGPGPPQGLWWKDTGRRRPAAEG